MIHWLLKTRHFVPNSHYDTVHDIDFDALYQEGKRVLLVDLDNTLIPYDETLPNKKLKAFIESIKHVGFEVVIISNNRLPRVKHFSDAVDVSYVASAKKPLKCGFKRAMQHTETFYEKAQVCMIGDQLMTDVFGSRRMGYDCLLVMPIKKKTEKWYTKFNRRVETNMLRKIKRKYPSAYKRLALEKRL